MLCVTLGLDTETIPKWMLTHKISSHPVWSGLVEKASLWCRELLRRSRFPL